MLQKARTIFLKKPREFSRNFKDFCKILEESLENSHDCDTIEFSRARKNFVRGFQFGDCSRF